tara:strand:- start:629 stop:1237 length:609 start_codon:yes stop_codon:yes gene_type:complete
MSSLESHIDPKLKQKINNDFLKYLDSKYLYHNLHHTQRVIKSAIKIGSYYDLSSNEWKILLTACLLHDYGFIKSHVNHEEIGAELAESILKNHNYNNNEISSVQSLILVTKAISIPNNNLESIIRDSDLEYLGSNDFQKISEYLREEWLLCGVVSNDKEFYKLQFDFLINHQFHTDFMRKNGKKLKEKNLRYAHEMMKKSHH